MSALIIVEHNNTLLQPSIYPVLAAAKQLDEKLIVLVVGYNCQQVAAQAAKIAGVDAVWCADNICYELQLAENVAPLIAHLAPDFTAILAASSTYGKNLLPRVAALLDVAQISDVVTILDQQTFARPIYAGNALETVKSFDAIKVLTIRTTAFDGVITTQAACPIKPVTEVFSQSRTLFINHQLTQSARPDLQNAKIVVAGGRGLQSAEKFKLIEGLADALGAAVGASRAAVDAGFVPNDCQVGQTGKIVAPTLYIAVGISGAVQHLAGMKDSKVIVAINKDESAPILQLADYYLVGDLFILIPELIKLLLSKSVADQ